MCVGAFVLPIKCYWFHGCLIVRGSGCARDCLSTSPHPLEIHFSSFHSLRLVHVVVSLLRRASLSPCCLHARGPSNFAPLNTTTHQTQVYIVN